MARRSLALAAVLAALALGGISAEATGAPSSSTIAAKSCSSGYRHAVIGGAHKCLRRGQFCAVRYDRQYHRYGYHCHSGRLR